MSIEIKVPGLPESVADAVVSAWHVKAGDVVEAGAPLLDLETDKVMLEVPAPSRGRVDRIVKQQGSTVLSGELLGVLESVKVMPSDQQQAKQGTKSDEKTMPTPSLDAPSDEGSARDLSPAVRRLILEHGLDATLIKGTGKGGRLTKADIMQYRQTQTDVGHVVSESSAKSSTEPSQGAGDRMDRREPMSRLRAKIAERLVSAQHEAAMLTTFNEVDLLPVKDMRARYRDSFEKKHGIRLGFMSFFVRATAIALQRFPKVNASIDKQDIVYHDYVDVGIAVSSERGLLVPVVRDADHLSMAEIERSIAEYADKARHNKITLDDMAGGTFTITNGGVFGSMLSTPIINPPQSAILGMHNIIERPVVVDGKIVVRPMMYLALSYDHRIIDGRDSVQFLVTIKQLLEEPARLLLDI